MKPRGRRRGVRLALAGAIAGVLVVGCVRHPGLPANSTADFAAKGSLTAEDAISALATTRLGLDAEALGRTTQRYLEVLVSDQEDGLEGTVGSFEAVAPPTPASRVLRERLTSVLGDAQDDLAAVRIALDDGRTDEAVAMRADLRQDEARLETFVIP